LTKAIDDLNRHMKAAGITGNKIGGFILDAFGRRPASACRPDGAG
jgi:hypothetical protein